MKLIKYVFTLLCLCAVLSLVHANEAQAGTRALASYYDLSGATTASGDVLSRSSWTTAHKTLSFGTEVTVCYSGVCAHNVVVTDRGPYSGGRELDLHIAPAEAIGLTGVGVGSVRWYVESPGLRDGKDITYVR